jgi:hypothetical protein
VPLSGHSQSANSTTPRACRISIDLRTVTLRVMGAGVRRR